MAKIYIEWLADDHHCDTCGTSYASGANVHINDELAIELEPVAHCYGGAHYDDSDVFKAIIQKLGHELTDTPAYDVVEL